MYKCYIFLVFMVIILPSMGLTRYLSSNYFSFLSLELEPPLSNTVGLPVVAADPILDWQSRGPAMSLACPRYHANSKVSAINSALTELTFKLG